MRLSVIDLRLSWTRRRLFFLGGTRSCMRQLYSFRGLPPDDGNAETISAIASPTIMVKTTTITLHICVINLCISLCANSHQEFYLVWIRLFPIMDSCAHPLKGSCRVRGNFCNLTMNGCLLSKPFSLHTSMLMSDARLPSENEGSEQIGLPS